MEVQVERSRWRSLIPEADRDVVEEPGARAHDRLHRSSTIAIMSRWAVGINLSSFL